MAANSMDISVVVNGLLKQKLDDLERELEDARTRYEITNNDLRAANYSLRERVTNCEQKSAKMERERIIALLERENFTVSVQAAGGEHKYVFNPYQWIRKLIEG